MMNESVFVGGVVRSATQITKSSHRRHLFVPKKRRRRRKEKENASALLAAVTSRVRC
jgi:hypothetical protein